MHKSIWTFFIFVSIGVAKGKDVSSFVVELATIAATYGLDISPRDLILLCQKMENHDNGTPCSVMGQITPACGETCSQGKEMEFQALPCLLKDTNVQLLFELVKEILKLATLKLKWVIMEFTIWLS